MRPWHSVPLVRTCGLAGQECRRDVPWTFGRTFTPPLPDVGRNGARMHEGRSPCHSSPATGLPTEWPKAVPETFGRPDLEPVGMSADRS